MSVIHHATGLDLHSRIARKEGKYQRSSWLTQQDQDKLFDLAGGWGCNVHWLEIEVSLRYISMGNDLIGTRSFR